MNKTDVKFGTDGIRGYSENFPFTNKALNMLGVSIAKWSKKKYKGSPKVLIGHDTRTSCKRIKKQLEKGLLSLDLDIYDAKILPTPAICKIANKYKKFDFGIIISASHNPYYDNGIKLIDAKMGKLKPEDEKSIEENFEELYEAKDYNLEKKGSIKLWDKAEDKYEEIITSLFKKNFLNNKKIVLDCANGSTYKLAPKIFEELGAQVIAINNTPNGKNINYKCGALETNSLSQEVVKQKAIIGFAFDGDGDRVIAVDKKGNVVDGDQIIALLSEYPTEKNNKTIVGTIMSNLGLDLYLKTKNINLVRTDVGDKYVAAKLLEKKLFLGGEASGHIIMSDYLNTGDGIFTALRIAQTAILKNNWEIKIFEKIPQITINMPISYKKDLNIIPCSEIISKHKKLLKTGRIIVRYSGTENLLRIMIESKEEKLANKTANSLAKNLRKELG